MSGKISPALTPESWEVALQTPEEHFERTVDAARQENYHECAALALHGQPFGFGLQDVGLIRDEAEMTRLRSTPEVNPGADAKDRELLQLRASLLDDLADRIAALLPPRKLSQEL
ncbi:MAG TPA: hypothetical protein VD930_13845 [Gemmatimonadales bacterium]|nr:hypothetical protein [Gemmatimonadales bacterium]